LKVGLQEIYFYFIFSGNSVLHAVSCLLGYLPNDTNQPSTSCALLRHDYFDVLTPILTLLKSFWHEDMLGLVRDYLLTALSTHSVVLVWR